MQELILQTYCDHCFDTDESKIEDPIEGRTIGVDVPFRGVLRIDLCGTSYKELVAPLAELLAELPVMAGERRPEPATLPFGEGESFDCPYCMFSDTGRPGIIGHLWQVHTKSKRTGRYAVPSKCPECGTPAGGNQGMSAHRRTAHGYDPLAEALKATKAKGNFVWSKHYPERKKEARRRG